MDTLFTQYVAEREGLETYVHEDKGFMTFKICGEQKKEFYIRDMYVAPEFRRKRVCYEMADRVFAIAKNRGCEIVSGTLYRGARGNTESMQTMLGYGFSIHRWDAEKIVVIKEL